MSSAISPMADQQHTPATPENAVSASSKGKGKDVNLAVLNPRTIDEMMRYRARLTPDLPLVSYPSSGIDYVNYTSLQLDVFAFRAAKYYALHMPSRSSSIEKPKVIGLLGPSDFNYIITMLSLWKVGHTVLLLSTRIAKEAHISLLKATGAKDLLFHESMNEMASRLRGELPYLRIQKFISQSVYNYALGNEPIDTSINLSLDLNTESGYLACIIHSSGSTGLPKPVYFPQNVIVKVSGSNMNMKGYTCAPFYHAFGVGTLLRAIHSGKQLYIYNAALPLTRQYLIGTMRTHDFEIFYCVPYALKLLAESAEGVKFLAGSKIVMFAGSACSDSLGNRLTDCGVKLVSDYGSSETGPLMTSLRPEGDTAWDYLRPLPAVKPFLRFEERGDNIFELVCLDGLPSKSTHNRPDKSYATKDLFSKHPTIESAYKYFSRLDDTIVLANGEKANPLIIEGMMREHKFIAEAVAFGAGKASLGLMIIPSDAAANLSKEGLLDSIWPFIELAQASMPAYARLSRSMVVILPPNTIYSCTDKGTVIRQAFYRQFQQDIEDAYEEKQAGGHLTLSEEGLRDFLRKEVAMILQLEDASMLSDDADFFSLGMDSLQSTQLRGILVRSINTRGGGLSLNVVFEHPSLRSLALRLHSLREGQKEMANTTEDEMYRLIAKYGVFTNNVPRPNGLEGSREHSTVVTGATGSLGAHVVVDLVTRSKVKRVYCLVRASSTEHAQSRVVQSLKSRKLYDSLPTSCKEKIIALPSNFGLPGLDLEPQQHNKIAMEVTSLIHCAWSVNFNLRLTSFEKDIAGTKHLIELCLDSRRTKPAIFSFCSSISTMLNAESDTILEALPAKLSDAQNTGYAQSKLVAENLCQIAADQTGMTTHILRIGQVVGDTKNGIWNTNEAIPMTLQTSTTINALPQLDEWHRWLPVDRVAKIVTEITQSNASSGVANIVNPNAFHWTKDLLPYVKASGLQFSELNPREWIQRLRFSDPDPVTNPPVMLLEFFANNYNKGVPPRLPPEWRTAKAQRWSRTFAEGFIIDQVLVDKIIGYFTSSCWSVPLIKKLEMVSVE